MSLSVTTVHSAALAKIKVQKDPLTDGKINGPYAKHIDEMHSVKSVNIAVGYTLLYTTNMHHENSPICGTLLTKTMIHSLRFRK